MEDYREEPRSRRRELRQSIESLQGKLKNTRNKFQQSSIADELSKLEQERMQLDTLFEDDPNEVAAEAQDEAPEDEYPLLNEIYQKRPESLQKTGHLERDVRASILYLEFFESEFLGMFTSRKMRLDVQYSVERDSFYDLYHQVERSLTNYRNEADRILEGSYSKQFEGDILKRKVEMQHATLIEIDWLMRKLVRFAKELIDDIESDGLFTQNPNERLNYSGLDKEQHLRGKTVEQGIRALSAFAAEAVAYLDIPEFQQREL